MRGSHFPDDENGRVLRAIAEQGVDLTIPRDVEFAHLFPGETEAGAFARQAASLGYRTEIYEPDEEALEEGVTDWDVICTRRMVPTHPEISRTEAELAAIAQQCGGQEDGWGFLSD
ncbi:MAG: ribonuclease E inhibitor RraB [Armatimonadota bacterium]